MNVCRHRGAVLMDGCGKRETLQCHYHAWTYDLDGSLRAAPRSEREPGLRQATTGRCCPRASARGARSCSSTRTQLHRRSTTHLGRPADDPRAGDRRRRARLPLARRVRRERELEDRRRELPRVLPLPDRPPRLQRRGRRASRPLPARGATRRSQRSSRRREARPASSAASSTCSSRTPASTSSPAPRTSRSGRSRRTARAGPSATSTTSSLPALDDDWIDEFFAFDDQVGREDTALVESVHRGMASGMLEHGRLLLNAEPLLAAFQAGSGPARLRRRIDPHPQPTRQEEHL